jgi:predicted Zn-dependent protease
MPGQKLWLWDLSRGGGIWEDLLTDNDGQYIEFQAGRLFDQYSAGAINPISQVGFDPLVMDTWSEIWFPYKEIGGMVDASKHGVLNVEYQNGQIRIGLNALQELNHEIQVKVNEEIVLKEMLNIESMQVYSTSLAADSNDKVEVSLGGTELKYNNDPNAKLLKRPFYPDENLKISESEQKYQEGLEALQYREYTLARKKLAELLEHDPSHRGGHIAMAELEYRKTRYEKALEHCNKVLKMDTYDPGANYFAGIAYRAEKDHMNALESLGWAARDMKYRSVAFALMAEIYLADKNFKRANMYAAKALGFNLQNVNAREVLLILSRIRNEKDAFESYAKGILEVDPLNHFVAMESSRSMGFPEGADTTLLQNIQGEFRDETMLGLALRYNELGFETEALLTLLSGPKSQKNNLWAAYMQKDSNLSESNRMLDQVISLPVNLVFPYRRETIPVLEWAVSKNNSWKLKYYLAQNYLAVGLGNKGKALLKELGDLPDSDVFYRFRASLLKEATFEERTKDYQKAMQLNTSDWKVWEETIQFYLQKDEYDEAHALSKKAFKKFKGNYNIELAHAKALLNTGKFTEVLKVLKKIQVLPYEHASESRKIYERAHLAVAQDYLMKKKYKAAISILEKSKEWPENIGVGKPYDPDERMQDYLLAISYGATVDPDQESQLLQNIVTYTDEHLKNRDIDHLFGLLALKKLGDQNRLDELLALLENDDPMNRLTLSLFKNKMDTARALREEQKIPQDIWDGLLAALTY